MRIGLPSVDALLVTSSVAALVLSVGLVQQPSGSSAAQASSADVGTAPGQRLRLLVVAADSSPADVAVGTPVAHAAGGALMAVGAAGLTDAMAAELSRSKPDAVLILGGPAAVSEVTASALAQYTSGPVTRLAGPERFATAAMVAGSRFVSPVRHLRIMSGDAPAGPSTAAGGGADAPVLLVHRDRIPSSTAAALRDLRPRRISVSGGPAAVSNGVLEQLGAFTPGRVVRSP